MDERKFPLGFTPDFDWKKSLEHYEGNVECGAELTVLEAEVYQEDERVYCRVCFMNI